MKKRQVWKYFYGLYLASFLFIVTLYGFGKRSQRSVKMTEKEGD